ncbi:MAG: hypothetical protein IH851_13845, partial [Armatimonadetes bacterium]|nr:hypothetical protein [Armatimonadota bacterium]
MRRKVLFAAVVAFSVSPVLAQLDDFTLTDGTISYSERNLRDGGAGSGLGDFMVGGTDHMFQNWFWFRGGSLGNEVALSNQTFGSLTGANIADLTYVEATGAGDLQFDLRYTLTSHNNDTRGDMDIDITVTNLSGQRLFFDMFSYTDYDLGGTLGGVAKDAETWLAAMDEGDMETAVLFPTSIGLTASLIWEPDVAVEVCRAYNRFMYEEFTREN